MIFTANNRNGGAATGLKAIALRLFIVPSILGNVGVIATDSSTKLPTPSAPTSTTLTTGTSAPECSAVAPVTVTVTTVTGASIISDTITPSVATSTTTVTISGTITSTVASVDGEETTSSCTSTTEGDVPFTTVETTSTLPDTFTSTVDGISTTTTTGLPASEPTTEASTDATQQGTSVFVTGIGATGTASWTISPSANGTFTYGVPSASVNYPAQTIVSAANGNGNRGSQVFYCVVMMVAVIGAVVGF
ncbi:hypothetical protein QBC43DRAFT_283687 [Cladorrhinum sp. PSN259]|nr:hypothetical protein QBC43DRAFT_283687 [Cladorrhinum sp. PSN259]